MMSASARKRSRSAAVAIGGIATGPPRWAFGRARRAFVASNHLAAARRSAAGSASGSSMTTVATRFSTSVRPLRSTMLPRGAATRTARTRLSRAWVR